MRTIDPLGNFTQKAGLTMGYRQANGMAANARPHAVKRIGSQTFWYDHNGNPSIPLRASMTKHIEGGVTYDPQVYDVQNRLVSVTKVGTGATTFAYDAAGIRVKTVHPGGKTSYYPFPGYEEEVNGSTTTRRVTYAVAGQTVALRVQVVVVGGSNTLYYLHSDHPATALGTSLGSTSLATTTAGAVVSGSTSRYHPFGGFRTTPTAGLTDVGFTGHRHNNLGAGDLGLVYMGARFYLPYINRFISADPIIPDPTNPQSFNRYSYVYNNPLVYVDEDGHVPVVPLLLVGAFVLWASVPTPPPPPPPDYMPISNKFYPCTASLAACHQASGLRQFTDGEQISGAEFNELLEVVALEMYSYHTPGFRASNPISWLANHQAGRGIYDTPFYNGGGRAGLSPSLERSSGIAPSTQQVCLEQGCFGRSAINYFAQGMWAAAAGDSLEDALRAVRAWNATSYGLTASEIEDRLFWTRFGYDWYLDWINNHDN